MLCDLRLPKVNPLMVHAAIECVYATSGAGLHSGAKLLDLSIGLGDNFSQDCPPVSFYRLVLRESLWLRRVAVQPGFRISLGDLIAIFSTDPAEPDDGPVGRPARVATAGIMHHPGIWSAAVP